MSGGAPIEATAPGIDGRARGRSLAAIILHMIGIGLTVGGLIPLTSITFERWGEPVWLNGVAGAAPLVGIMATALMAPWVLRRLGAVAAMALGCALAFVAILLMAVFSDPFSWIVLRLITGAGLGVPWVAGESWINALTTDATRGRIVAIYAASFASGIAAGPLLLDVTGTEGWPPILLALGALLLAVLPLVLARDLAPDLTPHPSASIRGIAAQAPFIMLLAGLSGFAETMSISLLPVFGLRAGADEELALRILTLFTLGGIALQYPLGWLSDHLPRRSLIAGIGLAFASVALILPTAIHNAWTGAFAAFALGGAVLGFYALGLAALSMRFARDELATANAAFVLFYQVGGIAGPLSAGAAMELDPALGFVTMLAAIGLVLAVAAMTRSVRGID